MDLNRAQVYRKLAGRVCGFFFLIALLAVLDGVIAKFRDPANVYHAMPGEEVGVNGPLPENIKQTEALTYESDSPDLAVVFDDIHAGYFMGGNMWRGRLVAGENLRPDKYTVTIRPKDYPREKPGFLIRVVVYPDPPSRQAASMSIIHRFTGRSPYLVAAGCLIIIGLAAILVYLLSRRIDLLQAKIGLAEIYHVARGEGNYLITFGLGSEHGLSAGDRVTLLDPQGNYVGSAQVEETKEFDSVASVAAAQAIRPGFLVSRDWDEGRGGKLP